MDIQYNIKPIAKNLKKAAALVLRVFEEFEAPEYGAEGTEEFKKFVQPSALEKRVQAGEMHMWAAFAGRQMVGVLAVRGAGAH